jgi:hypothetical protein
MVCQDLPDFIAFGAAGRVASTFQDATLFSGNPRHLQGGRRNAFAPRRNRLNFGQQTGRNGELRFKCPAVPTR